MKRLIWSALLLLVAAVMLGTSTFAWFSMNTQVSATGMQVVAKSDSTYLLISSTNSTASAIQAENSGNGFTTVALTVSDNDAKVYPSRPALSSAEAAYLTVAAGHYKTDGSLIATAGVQVDTAEKAGTVTNWYTANAQSSGASTIDSATAKQLASFDSFVIRKTVYLTVASGANDANNLTVTPTITQKGAGSDISAVKVLVVTGTNYVILSSANNGTPISIHETSNQTVTDTTVVTVNIYIYYDGEDSNVYTNNTANLTGATIDLLFGVDAVVA